MEKNQVFFSSLKDKVVRGLIPSCSHAATSPARSPSPISSYFRRTNKNHTSHVTSHSEEPLIGRSASLRPVMEGPNPDTEEVGASKRVGSGLGQWMRWEGGVADHMQATDRHFMIH